MDLVNIVQSYILKILEEAGPGMKVKNLNNIWKQCYWSVSFWYGSGSADLIITFFLFTELNSIKNITMMKKLPGHFKVMLLDAETTPIVSLAFAQSALMRQVIDLQFGDFFFCNKNHDFFYLD